MPDRILGGSDLVTTAGAAGAIMSPWWLPILQEISELAALLAPILGVAWLLVQISLKILEWRKRERFRADLQKALKHE